MCHGTNLFVGSVGFSLRKKGEYIVFPIKSSWKDFAEKWFYIDLWEKNVIRVDYRMPLTSEAWYSTPIMTERMQRHIERVWAVREAGLTTAHIFETFARWRIIPLKRRSLACTYSGTTDPNRESVVG